MVSDKAIVAVKLALIAFVVLLGANPRWPLSRFMFKSRGPRSDVECLTRRQLFAEGVKFLYLAVLCFLALWAAGTVADAMGRDLFERPLATGAFFIVAILFAMFVLGGAYMLVRGLFRSPGYVPPPRCGQAPAAVATDDGQATRWSPP
jgi:hypothetical protein